MKSRFSIGESCVHRVCPTKHPKKPPTFSGKTGVIWKADSAYLAASCSKSCCRFKCKTFEFFLSPVPAARRWQAESTPARVLRDGDWQTLPSHFERFPVNYGRAKKQNRPSGGRFFVLSVGARGFEPPASCTPCKRASRTAPRPD